MVLCCAVGTRLPEDSRKSIQVRDRGGGCRGRRIKECLIRDSNPGTHGNGGRERGGVSQFKEEKLCVCDYQLLGGRRRDRSFWRFP